MNSETRKNYLLVRRLKSRLNQLYKDRNIISTLDRRRIMKEAIGEVVKLSSIQANQLEMLINYINKSTDEHLQSPIIAWAYMVQMDDGVKKRQVQNMLHMIPSDKELFPFSLDDSKLLESNSMALGFIENDFYDDLHEVKKILAAVCNDWDLESSDGLYHLPDGKQIKMLCDYETAK